MKALGLTAILASALFFGGFASVQAAGTGDLEAKISVAKTAADHEEIARIYDAAAKEALGKSQEHKQMAQLYSKTFVKGPAGEMKSHCAAVSEKYAGIAADDTALAKLHRQMASEVK